MEPDPPNLSLGAPLDRRHDAQVDGVPVAPGRVDAHVLERRAEELLHPGVCPNVSLNLVDYGQVRRAGRRSDQSIHQARRLEQRRHPLEDEQVASEDKLSAPLVVERAGEGVDRGAQVPWPVASCCFGVSFFGSMNGFSTTTADAVPSGRSTSNSVPSSLCSIGTIA